MRRAVTQVTLAALASLVSPAAAAPAPAPARSIQISLADVATRFCVDVLSRKVTLPAPGDDAWFARYGLAEGIPPAAAAALGPEATGVIGGATLASGEAGPDGFIVALGGGAGETCRIIVYRTVRADLGWATMGMMTAPGPGRGWKLLPPSAAEPIVVAKLSLLKRQDGRAYLANLLTPPRTGRIALAIVVAAIPPNVTLPAGF